MKPFDLSGNRPFFIAGAAAILFAIIAGRQQGAAAGRDDARTRDSSRLGGMSGSPDPNNDSGNSVRTTSSTSDEKIHRQLWRLWNDSPDANLDPETQAEITRLVAGMPSQQIEAFLRTLPPGSERGVGGQLRRIIVSCWVLQDGPAAMTFMATAPDAGTDTNRLDTTQTVMMWTADQPDAAFAWLNSEELPPGLKKLAANIRLNSLMTLMDTQPDRAFQELSSMESKDVSDQLRLWAGTHGSDPDVRQKLLDYAATSGRTDDLAQTRSAILQALAEKDPEAANDFLESLPTKPDERDALAVQLTLGQARKEPKAAFDRWLETADTANGVPQEIQFGIGAWMWRNPDETLQWLDALPPGGKRDSLHADSIPMLAGYDRFDKAAEIATGIASPSLRAEALHALDLRWSLVNQDAAEKWRQGLSSTDRGLLGK
jgi:hypothetical protein